MDHSTKNWLTIFDGKRTWVKRDIYFYSKNINDYYYCYYYYYYRLLLQEVLAKHRLLSAINISISLFLEGI